MGRPLTDGRYKTEMIDAERIVLKRALIEAGGDITLTARILQIDRKTLYYRLQYCGLDVDLIRAELEITGRP